MKNIAVILVFLAALSLYGDTDRAEIEDRLKKACGIRPRLIYLKADEQKVKERIASDETLSAASEAAIRKADKVIKQPPVVRELTGRRLLHKSRECLERVLHLSYAYRMTGDAKYLQRCEQEMLAAAAFSDWHPSHFLDVAEFTVALAFGYDWLYDSLGEESRKIIRQAIIDKGLKPSLAKKGTWWIKGNNNWNQVCHCGMVLGALAVGENEPKLAAAMIERAVNNLPCSMKEYAPDGAYPEGPSYWNYGTSFNVMLLAALESALGTDFGLSKQKGFMKTAEYYLHVAGPSHYFFNYSDCGAHSGPAVSPYWFASRSGDTSLLWREQQLMEKYKDSPRGRLFPLLLLWAGTAAKSTPPSALSWHGDGATPVGLHRSSWTDNNAVFVAIKAGSPRTNHGHMDAGSFVMDSDGVRWIKDLGSQGYHSLESKGVNLWNMRQDSQRWTVFRLSTEAHNTLMVNGKQQSIKGRAEIIKSSGKQGKQYTVIDMGKIYDGNLARAQRGVMLRQDRSVVLRDEIKAPENPAKVRWAVMTGADITIQGSSAIFRKKDKALNITVVNPENARLKIIDAEAPRQSYDASNPDSRQLIMELELEPNQAETITVILSPGSLEKTDNQVKPLDQW